MQRDVSASGRVARLKPLLAVLAIFAVAACRPTEREIEPPRPSEEELIASISDPEMRRRWSEAAAAGELPPVDRIRIPDRPLSLRSFPPSAARPGESRPPVIPASAVADVQPFLRKPLERYRGDFEVVRAEPGLLVGRLDGVEESLELHYKLPGGGQLSVPSAKALRLDFRDEIVDTALQRRVVLATSGGAVSLLYLSEGSGEWFRATFEELRIRVEQLAPRDDGLSPVAVTYGGLKVTLRPGDRQRLGEVDVFLIGSLAPFPEADWVQEGQPYAVTLLLYRSTEAPG